MTLLSNKQSKSHQAHLCNMFMPTNEVQLSLQRGYCYLFWSLNTHIHAHHSSRAEASHASDHPNNHPEFINEGEFLSRNIPLRFAVEWVCYLAAYVTLSSSNTLLSFTWSSFRATLASGSNCKERNSITFYLYTRFLGFPLQSMN